MSLVSTIRAMQAAGIPESKILETVILIEDERLANGRARTAKHRNKNNNSNECNVTRVTPVTKKEKTPIPPKEKNLYQKEKPPSGSKRKRGSRLPDPWSPEESLVSWAKSEFGVAESVLRRETEKFCDYWRGIPGQRGTKLDWNATWRNWMRNARFATGPPADRMMGQTIREVT